jgi:iron complex transport system substrate-binding protein
LRTRLVAVAIAALAMVGVACPGDVGATPRIVSLDQCADQYVLALAPRGEIVALSKRATNDDSYLKRAAAGLPQRRATLESILGERATIAVTYWAGDLRLPAALSTHGVKVVQIDEASDFDGVSRNIRQVAAALGQDAAGRRLIARMDGQLAQSRGAWAGTRAIYLTPGGFTAGRGTLVGAMMAAAGLVSAAPAAGYTPVSLEGLVLNPPAALVLGFFSDLAGGRSRWTIAGNGYLQTLNRDRAVASLPGSILGCPAWFAADGTLALARARQGR